MSGLLGERRATSFVLSSTVTDVLFAVGLLVLATLYATVGQAGGTGYVALMGIAGFDPATIKPTALTLNILVSTLGCLRFHRAGILTWRSCYPFAVLGLPFSLLGGSLHLPASAYQPVVGGLLLVAGIQMLRSVKLAAVRDQAARQVPPFGAGLLAGGAIGLVSGITGVGGGIFLAPVILAFGWSAARQTAAISAMFNLLNSAAALAGAWATMPALPERLFLWLVCVGVGGLVGSWLATRHLNAAALRLLLALLLLSAAARMIATAI